MWFEDAIGNNRFLKDHNDIVIFNDENFFKTYCCNNKLQVSTNILELDIDRINSNTEDYDLLIDFWNCISDLAVSSEMIFLGDSDDDTITDLYNRLFVNTEASKLTKNYSKSNFSENDYQTINDVITSGINLVIDTVKKYGVRQR